MNLESSCIIEGIVTTHHADGRVNISPMGPWVDPTFRQFTLRPYAASTTLANLKRSGEGVFHVTDDVELLAHAAVGELASPPPMVRASSVEGSILSDACRWYAFRVRSCAESGPRAELDCEVVEQGTFREFLGFNRAKHAVLEGAILATRLRWLDRQEIDREFARLATIVEKTAGPQERRAFKFLRQFIDRAETGRNDDDA